MHHERYLWVGQCNIRCNPIVDFPGPLVVIVGTAIFAAGLVGSLLFKSSKMRQSNQIPVSRSRKICSIMYKEYHSRFLQDMEHKPFAIYVSVITPVAVAAILILGTLTTISSTSQAFAYISYHKGHYHKSNHGYYTTYRHTRRGNVDSNKTIRRNIYSKMY